MEDIVQYYMEEVLQLIKIQGNCELYFFVKTDYCKDNKLNIDKLKQDLSRFNLKNLQENILKHFENSKGENLSYYNTNNEGKIFFKDFIVLNNYNDIKVFFMKYVIHYNIVLIMIENQKI